MNPTTPSSPTPDLQDNVLTKIRTGEVRMRPRIYFVAQVVLVVVVAVLTLITSALLLSFVLFSIRISGQLFLLGFGSRGLLTFFTLFPWTLCGLELLLLILLEWSIGRFKFAHRIPFVYLLGGVVLLTVLISFTINLTTLHHHLLDDAEHQDLPVIGGMYSNLRRPPPAVGEFRGTVDILATSSFVMAYQDQGATSTEEWTVLMPPGDISSDFVMVGDRVFVAGDEIGPGQVRAYGIRKLNPDDE